MLKNLQRTNPVLVGIAVAAGVLPIVGVNIAYWVAASAGHVPSCFPFLDGCTSVSAVGRQFPENLFFRGGMLPAAVLITVYGYLAREWLKLHGDTSAAARVLPRLWLLASVFLVIYTFALGKIADWYGIQRRIAVVSYLSLSFLCQLMLTWRIDILRRAGKMQMPGWLFRSKMAVSGLMLAIGLLSIPDEMLLEDTTSFERILEWNFCFLIAVYYPLTGIAWRLQRFTPDFRS